MVEVLISDLTSKMIKTFVLKEYGPGIQVIRWDLMDSYGNKVNPGVYFCRINYGNDSEMHKMIVQ